MLEYTRDTEVTKLYRQISRQENILWFQISMDDPTGMHILKRQTYLDEPVENLGLCKVLALADLPLDVVAEVSYLAVLHYDDKFLECEVALLVGHNVWVVQIFQKINFQHGAFFLLLLQPWEHYLLGNVLFVLGLMIDQVSSS